MNFPLVFSSLIRTFAAAIRKIRSIRRGEEAVIKGFRASEGCYGKQLFNHQNNYVFRLSQEAGDF